MEHIEYEERVLINETDYQKIIADIKNMNKPYVVSFIENIYLDNDSRFINNHHMMLRIRTINNKDQELTLKMKNPDLSTREINETLSKHPIIDKELNNEFDSYHEVARLVTERIEIELDDYLLVLDKNIYHGIIDFDIEIEAKTQQKAYELIKMYCKRYNLEYKNDYKVKSRRAIEMALKKDEVAH